MGFYYGSSQPPEEKGGGIKEIFQITWAVLSVLALPLGILFGGIVYLVLLFFLFTVHPLAGIIWILLPVSALIGRAVWEWKNPPVLK